MDPPTECLCITYCDPGYSDVCNEFFIPTDLYYEWEDFTLPLLSVFEGTDNDGNSVDELPNFGFHYVTIDGIEIGHSGIVTYERFMRIFQKAQDYEELGEELGE